MRNLFKQVLAVAFGVCVCGAATTALAQTSGFYIKADLGGSVTQDIDVEDFFGINVSGAKLQLDPGVRGGFSGGYQVTEWFATEVELGFMINEITSVEGGGAVDDATFSSVPLLVSVKLQYPLKQSGLTPYVGAGVGFSQSIFDAGALRIGDVTISGSDTDSVFAWQAFAGLRYAVNERVGISVEYRFFEADSPSWEAEHTRGTYNDVLGLGRTRTQSISLAFDFRF